MHRLVFLSTKLWPSEYENPNAVDETLERLGVDYVDLLYITSLLATGLKDTDSLRRLIRKARHGRGKEDRAH